MKYINRELKGTYGYIRKQLIFEAAKTLILFAMAVGIFLMGYLTLHTKKSLWSVLAVLALLPTCRSMVGVVMLLRYRSLSPEDHRRFCDCTGGMNTIFENILTTNERTFFLPVICVCSKNVIAYMPSKDTDNRLKEHIDSVLKNAGHSANVKIYDSLDAFEKRCLEMSQKLSSESDTGSAAIIDTIKAVSL
ncbi:MAG: hypothetical protein K6E49_10030 [Lachnospiraceae bacterium]|nr:hypothetical protein [Lachnospiraceae bacterium]